MSRFQIQNNQRKRVLEFEEYTWLHRNLENQNVINKRKGFALILD